MSQFEIWFVVIRDGMIFAVTRDFLMESIAKLDLV